MPKIIRQYEMRLVQLAANAGFDRDIAGSEWIGRDEFSGVPIGRAQSFGLSFFIHDIQIQGQNNPIPGDNATIRIRFPEYDPAWYTLTNGGAQYSYGGTGPTDIQTWLSSRVGGKPVIYQVEYDEIVDLVEKPDVQPDFVPSGPNTPENDWYKRDNHARIPKGHESKASLDAGQYTPS